MSLPITESGQLKFTSQEIAYLQSYLDVKDRGGYYMALYNMTGNTQALQQAQVATFSEGAGGAAYFANLYLDENTNDYPDGGVFMLSQLVAKFSLDKIKEELTTDPSNTNTGYIDENAMFASAQAAWGSLNIAHLFPGNLLSAGSALSGALQNFLTAATLVALPPPLTTMQNVVNAIVDLQNQGNLNFQTFLDYLLTTGSLAAFIGTLGAPVFGKELSDYEGRPGYRIIELPDAAYKVVIDLSTNKVAGVFDNTWLPQNGDEFLNGIANNWTTFVGIPGNMTAAFVTEFISNSMAEWRRTSSDYQEAGSSLPELVPKSIASGGNDVIWGESGFFSGDDTINGGPGDDIIFGGGGDDTLSGSIGDDIVYGQQDDDTLYGNVGKDTLRGGSGDDHLDGGEDDDMLDGAGNDIYTVDNALDIVTENLNEGTDRVNSSIAFSIATFANVENLTLTGANAINATGNTLDNVLTGNTGNNSISGGAGNDTIDGSTGNDTMVGGAGNDVYFMNVAADVVTELANEGTDAINSAVTLSIATLTNIENITLTGSALINATGNTLDNILIGNTGNNSISGGAGNDTIDGGTGNDTMVGGAGNDVYFVNIATDVLTEIANEGIDTVNSAVTYSIAALANLENVTLTGSTAINSTGNALANTLIGNSGNNILTGGTGADILTGGLGADTFDFNAILESLVGTSRDVITDFSRVQVDKIDLSTIDANTALANDQAFLATILTSGAFTAAGQLRLVGNVLSGNTDSNFATSEFEIQLTGVTTLAGTDFIL
jgi:Ca2+-binding RTX toxin-like protein